MKKGKGGTSVKMMLNKTRILNSGVYPLVFQLIHCRSKRLIYTGYHFREDEFDPEAETICRCEDSAFTIKDVEQINLALRNERKKINKRIHEYEKRRVPFTVADLLESPVRKSGRVCLLQYFDIQINRKKAIGKDGIAAAYLSTRVSLWKYLKHADIHLSAIDYSFVDDYRDFLYCEGLSENSVCYYLRNLRTIYNCAITNGECASPKSSPFSNVHTRPENTIKRALSIDELQALASLSLADKAGLAFYRDLYLFSFYAQGMAFVDIVYLKKKNICGGVLTYFRHKSKQLIRIHVTSQMQQLMDRFTTSGEYVFPILDISLNISLYSQYRLALGCINRRLKTIARLAETNIPLTTYTARHTWATLAHDCGAPISAISVGLGHTSEEMTRIYLKELDMEISAQVNSQVSDLIRQR